MASAKPFKVVLRGLPDLDTDELKQELVDLNLSVEGIFKIVRRKPNIKYRDQLFLIHMKKGSTTLKDLKNVKAIFNIIVEWEKYRPINKGATQCQNCLLYGHGTKNCHLKSRCAKCGKNHKTEECILEQEEGAAPKCANCGADHATTSRSCPKRAEFIQIRQGTASRRYPKRKNEVNLNLGSGFPELVTRASQVPNLPPLPLPASKTQPTNQTYSTNQSGHGVGIPGSSRNSIPHQHPPGLVGYAEAVRTPPEELYSDAEKAKLFTELVRQDQACRTKQEQIAVMLNFYYHHGLIAQSL